MANLEEWRAINKTRDDAKQSAEREYNSALIDFNEGVRVARRKYDDAIEAAEAGWRRQLEKLEPIALRKEYVRLHARAFFGVDR